MGTKKSTVTDLPKDIETLIPFEDRTPLINLILKEARLGEFHDFKNEKYSCGKMQVVTMMKDSADSRLRPIIDAVINGDYDESPDENDIANMERDWVQDGGTLQSFNRLFRKDNE